MAEGDVLESPHKGQRGLRRLWNALGFSLSGLRTALRHESAFRQEVALAAVLLPLACVLPVDALARLTLVGVVLEVLVAELLNSAVEATVDRVGLDTHRLAKRAKDFGSAAVLVALVHLALVWAVIAGPEFARFAGVVP